MAAGKGEKWQLEMKRNGSWKGREMAAVNGEKSQLEKEEKWQLDRERNGS